MKGIIIHPLRLRALDRMSVLRVPFREQPPDDSWFVGIGRSRGNPVAIFQAGATQYPVRLPYAPGDYFVKETWQICPPDKMLPGEVGYPWHGNSALRTVFKADVKFDTHPDHPEWGKQRWRPSIHLDEHDARYIVTLGPPVPCRLGEVDVVQQRDEGVIIEIGDEYRRTWDALYPKHPYSPELWTWGYPMEVRRR